jgi:hypothetical protein
MEEINPLTKVSVEDEQRKRNSGESENFTGKPNKTNTTFIEIKEKEKANKLKVRTERQMKGLEAAQKKGKKENREV